MEIFKSIDVLIIGAGPAGYTAAMTLQRYGVDFLMIDEHATTQEAAHPSLIQPQTQEIFHAMGILETLDSKGCRISESSLWEVRGNSGQVARASTFRLAEKTQKFPYLLSIGKGVAEETFEGIIHSKGQFIQRNKKLLAYRYSGEQSYTDWPVTAFIQDLRSGSVETWSFKYIIVGDTAKDDINVARDWGELPRVKPSWLVADVVLECNFTDLRRLCSVIAPMGTFMSMPGKDNRTRIFFQLTQQEIVNVKSPNFDIEDGLHASESFKLQGILSQRLSNGLFPRVAKVTEVVTIGQYEPARFLNHVLHDGRRIFTMGVYSCNHNIETGLGINASCGDAYNLTWKLALVLKDMAKPELLATYQIERENRQFQLQRLEDRFKSLLGGVEWCSSRASVFQEWEHFVRSTMDYDDQYPRTSLSVDIREMRLSQQAPHPPMRGRRLYPIDLIRHVDGNHVNLLHEMPSKARFHILVFAGELITSRVVAALGEKLVSRTSPLNTFNRTDCMQTTPFSHEDIYTESGPCTNWGYVIDLSFIHTQDHVSFEVKNLPSPFSTVWSDRVYEDPAGKGHAQLGISLSQGALILARPDGYVSAVTRLEYPEDFTACLKAILKPQPGGL